MDNEYGRIINAEVDKSNLFTVKLTVAKGNETYSWEDTPYRDFLIGDIINIPLKAKKL